MFSVEIVLCSLAAVPSERQTQLVLTCHSTITSTSGTLTQPHSGNRYTGERIGVRGQERFVRSAASVWRDDGRRQD
ncbi:hypothetical protein DPMN_065067 [Dreissena polymorpha]|uniref:Uncharacterized protein n=1 Tax=Dreissena polymorpha TaxID=45954 RepID=A0A9D4CEN1_DREPO|nr:hypothetical protein DPMN_065067 [Dreissena polymorpha]